MENSNQQKEQLIDSLLVLYEKYKDDDYMSQKLSSYVSNQLPNIMVNLKNQQLQRINCMEEMTNEQDDFINSFLANNQYFYVHSTNNYFIYDGFHYQIKSEDDILHHVLTSINKNKQLCSWKYKTKGKIMRRIKENNLMFSIPESETIQAVLNCFTDNLFSSKELTKYFLCVIGDNLLKKDFKLVHFMHPRSKEFIRNLDNVSNIILGQHISQSIKFKYHEHEYDTFRVIHPNEKIKNESNWGYILNSFSIDILCVACHYSNRYFSSDTYLTTQCNNELVTNKVLFIKNNTQSSLVDLFIHQYIDKDTSKSSDETNDYANISWNNMEYLWKLFIDEHEIPSVLFMKPLKIILIEKLQKYYNENLDIFNGIFSRFIPVIHNFLDFWNKTIVFDDSEPNLEIEELLNLFKRWNIANKVMYVNISSKQILDLITYYLPDVEIENDKYLIGIRCSLWDKQLDIQTSIENLKETLRTRVKKDLLFNTKLSVYETYEHYCKFTGATPCKPIVSKSYFEKYIFDNYSEYISNNMFIDQWYAT